MVRLANPVAGTLAAGTTVAGTNYFSFDPTTGPGYVVHCHILDHEDNEMMRPKKQPVIGHFSPYDTKLPGCHLHLTTYANASPQTIY